MKIKTDFITNSSSSSFIIAMQGTVEVDDETLKRYPFIAKHMELISKILLSGDTFSSVKELDEYFLDQYAWGDIDTIEKVLEDSYQAPLYNKCKEMLEKGFLIFEKCVEYSETEITNILYSLEDDETFIILEGGE